MALKPSGASASIVHDGSSSSNAADARGRRRHRRPRRGRGRSRVFAISLGEVQTTRRRRWRRLTETPAPFRDSLRVHGVAASAPRASSMSPYPACRMKVASSMADLHVAPRSPKSQSSRRGGTPFEERSGAPSRIVYHDAASSVQMWARGRVSGVRCRGSPAGGSVRPDPSQAAKIFDAADRDRSGASCPASTPRRRGKPRPFRPARPPSRATRAVVAKAPPSAFRHVRQWQKPIGPRRAVDRVADGAAEAAAFESGLSSSAWLPRAQVRRQPSSPGSPGSRMLTSTRIIRERRTMKREVRHAEGLSRSARRRAARPREGAAQGDPPGDAEIRRGRPLRDARLSRDSRTWVHRSVMSRSTSRRRS